MATWSVEPTWKKSIIERQEWSKDGQSFIYETGWRWGEFLVYTDDDNPPNIEAGVDIYCCGYETELVETWDGCWDDYDYDGCDDETREWLEEFLEENSVFDLEEHGWICGDTEMIIDCDLQITRVNDDGTKGEPITTGQSESDESAPVSEAPKLNPTAAWPFSTPVEAEPMKFKCTACDFETDDINELHENTEDDDSPAFQCPKCKSGVELE